MDPAPSDGPSPETPAADAAGSSTGSSAASNFFAPDGAGPAFDGDPGERVDAPELAPPPDEDHGLSWDRQTVEGLLIAKGAALHAIVGVGEQDWVYTQEELRAIAPPLTRILNRYPVTAAAAGAGDELALILGLAGYAKRSYDERAAVLRTRSDQAQALDPVAPVPDPTPEFVQAPPTPEVTPWA